MSVGLGLTGQLVKAPACPRPSRVLIQAKSAAVPPNLVDWPVSAS